ncbi:unnamed protein product [Trichogramma brassicae]|uniref:BRICHOS domain-containing protein n=1 Tax=Trichogramma brassicae TaxID=86971 RepID=A0A6H5I464_9HYME|nr:unnamed protein product [Trichogramma brassicae]
MRLVYLGLLLVLACCSNRGQAQRYHEKTRFDRSVSSDQLQRKHNRHLEINKKQRTITDPATQFTAYKDSHLNVCYLEKLQANELDDAKLWIDIIRGHKKVVFATNRPLKKIEAWHLAGQKIVDFCKGTSMFLLQESIPTRHEDPAFNQILEEKITIVKKAPHDERVKREAKARFRGQTQTQYMNLGGEGQNEGRAEAEATLQSSHAVVSPAGTVTGGNQQTVSQGKVDGGAGTGVGNVPGTYPGSTGINQGGQTNQGGGTTVSTGSQPGTQSNANRPGTQIQGQPGVQVPVNQPGTIPGTQIVNGQQPGVSVMYPGTQIIGYPSTQTGGNVGQVSSGMVYPPSQQMVGGNTQVPTGTRVIGQQPGTQIGNTGQLTYGTWPYPGFQPAGGGAAQYPVGVNYPNTQITGGTRGQGYPGAQTGGGGTPMTMYPSTQVVGGGSQTPGFVGNVGYPGMQQPVQQPTGVFTYPPGTQFVQGGSNIPQQNVIGTSPGGATNIAPGNMFPSSNTGSQPTGGYYPGTTGTTGGTVQGTGNIYTGTAGTVGGTVVSPGIGTVQIPGQGSGTGNIYPGTPGTSGGTVLRPGQVPGTGNIYPGTTGTVGGTVMMPGQAPGNMYPGTTGTVGGTILMPGQMPGGMYPGTTGTVGGTVLMPGQMPGNVYPGTTGTVGGTVLMPGQVPGGMYPGTTGAVGGTVLVPGLFPNNGNMYPTNTGTVGGTVYIPGQGSNTGTINTGITGTVGGTVYIPGQVPGSGSVGQPLGPGGYPGITGTVGGTVVTPGGGTALQPGQGTITGGVVPGTSGTVTGTAGQGTGAGIDDDGDSQAISSVKQGPGGTTASASAEGRHGSGSAKSQVSGTYNGGGSFSAQAGTSDDHKSAQTQVNNTIIFILTLFFIKLLLTFFNQISGGKEGAKSSAQGSGGLGKSQVQVELDSESGSTSTNAQSSGLNHGTNSQVQASSKGGMADAQANGEGQTSSQAQIGFQPYNSNKNEKPERRDKPFKGGGTASAQSGAYRGQSQSQLQGSFQYGITYTGAAQANSGSGSASLRKPFNFSTPDPDLFKPYKLEDNQDGKKSAEAPKEKMRASGTKQTVISINAKKNNNKNAPNYETTNEDDFEEEYEDEGSYSDFVSITPKPRVSSTSARPTSEPKHTMHVITDGEYDVKIRRTSGKESNKTATTARGATPTGRIKSSEATKNITEKLKLTSNRTQESSRASSDTKSLRTERIGGIYKMKAAPGPVADNLSKEEAAPKASYVSVTNSVAGKIDDKDTDKKYEHRYYTKSSTCGYFSFSCNVVYGNHGARKICKPKLPTYEDGTPKCT